jgi:hypothetical protein
LKINAPAKEILHKLIGNLQSAGAYKGAYKTLASLYEKFWLLFYFIATIAYLELIYKVWVFRAFNADYFFPFLFAFSAGTLLFLLIGLIPPKAAGIASAAVSSLLSLIYAVQIIYFCIFHTPLSLYSVGGAGDATQFSDIVTETVLKNAVVVVLLFVPPALLALRKGKPLFEPMKRITMAYILLFGVASYSAAIIGVSLTGDGPASQYTLYFKESSLEMSANKLGLLTTMRQDFQKLASGSLYDAFNGKATAASRTDADVGAQPGTAGSDATSEDMTGQEGAIDTSGSTEASAGPESSTAATASGEGSVQDTAGGNGDAIEASAVPAKPYNTMDIDLDKLLAASGQDENLLAMHKYFSTVTPTATNQYTGMFKGDNLILITAESFSPYFLSPELTPILYRMATEGFVFKNFYNPVWGVSTSDGEYVGCTGLIPKSGVWSFMKSGANYMPFCMGNQFRKLGYTTKAYHDHTYTYYKRDISHPNMGYDYKGYGNGLEVKKTWPESDLEMINITSSDFTADKPFHIYYMTVSGHMNYNFTGNYMAAKNRKYVENLPYSDPSKAYIACNLELEFAMEAMMKKLEELGIAEKTVIALSGDHYPYGLPRECIDELAGHKVEENFELYKSTFILWKKGMETVTIDKPCASLDRIPTLSNLFGLEYDSRLMMGTDILSDSPALVIFSNRSWITDRARYNTVTDEVEFFDGTVEDKAYVKKVNRIVADKFKYSAKILETNYYGRILK